MIFPPHIMRLRIKEIDLDRAARWWYGHHHVSSPDAFSNPDITETMVRAYHRHIGADWTHGDWMADRAFIWHGTYLRPLGLSIHTGLDLNVAAGTEVLAVSDGEILHEGTDAPLKGGWGHHVIQKIWYDGSHHAMLYAHLERRKPSRKGRLIRRGDCIGHVGTSKTNGYWYPHLHAQLFAEIDDVADWRDFSRAMDGYIRRDEVIDWVVRCPDPTPLVFA